MNTYSEHDNKPSRLNRIIPVLLAVFPYIPVAANIITYRYLSLDYAITEGIQLFSILIFLALTLAGWLKSFPDWSYPYTTIIVIFLFALLVSNDGDATVWENLNWKLLFMGPFVLLYVSFWLIVRKRYPLQILLHNLRTEVTLPAFCLYSLMAIAFQGVFTDIRSLYGAPFLITSTLIAMTGAVLYASLTNTKARLVSLVVCFTLAWNVMVWGSASFWDGRQEVWMDAPQPGASLAAGYILAWGVLVMLMLLPAVIHKRVLKSTPQKES